MKNILLLALVFITLACRETTSDDEITKTQLRNQLKSLQDLRNGDISEQLSLRTAEEKERLAHQFIASLDDATLKKLTESERFKGLIQKRALEDKEIINEKLLDLKRIEEGLIKDLGIEVERKVGVKRTLGIPTRNPYLQYSVKSKKGVYSCDKLEQTSLYWEDILSLKANPSLLLGISSEVFEQTIKSCLIYYRLTESIERCHFPYKTEMEEICQI